MLQISRMMPKNVQSYLNKAAQLDNSPIHLISQKIWIGPPAETNQGSRSKDLQYTIFRSSNCVNNKGNSGSASTSLRGKF